jgi:hypothetical protein
MLTPDADPRGRKPDIMSQLAWLVTWVEVGLLDFHAVDVQETSGVTAHHVIPGKSDDTPDVVALVGIGPQPRGYRTDDPDHRRPQGRTRSQRTTGKNVGAVEDDTVPSW